jgi:hypothetical protein
VALNLIITRTALQTRIGEARRVKLRLFASVAIYVCISVGIMIGMILFVVPGLILSACWSIAIPVAMVENRSPLAALERSAKLTVGNRWPIFGLQLSLVVSVFVWQWLVSKLLAGMLFDFWPLMAVNIMISLVSVALGLVFAVVWAEIFITLSRQRDRVEELDEIFA